MGFSVSVRIRLRFTLGAFTSSHLVSVDLTLQSTAEYQFTEQDGLRRWVEVIFILGPGAFIIHCFLHFYYWDGKAKKGLCASLRVGKRGDEKKY